MLDAASLFDLSDFVHAGLFREQEYAWTALTRLKAYLDNLSFPALDRTLIPDGIPLPQSIVIHAGKIISGMDLDIVYGDATKGKLAVYRQGQRLEGATVLMAGAILLGDQLDIGPGVLVESGAMIKSPVVIGENSEVRQAAYLRGYCLAGKRCVLGHATEVKHSVFLNDAKAGHFAYLGDSILGTDANLGAGTKFANLRFIKGNVIVQAEGQKIDSGLRKFGAILGDGSQTGCNSVTNPGTVFGRNCMLMPNTTAPSGFHPAKSLLR